MEKFLHRKSQSVMRPLREHVIPMTSDDSEESPGHKGLFTVPQGFFHKLWWLFCLPINMVLTILIIPCSTEKTRKLFAFTFINAIIVIGVLEFFVVEAVELIGEELNFNDELTGLLLLAPFTCLPEALTSIAVAKRGMGNALFSNVMGGNLFDILIATGIPWFIYTFIYPNQTLVIHVEEIVFDGIMLVTITMIAFITIVLAKFKLSRTVGAIFVSCYVLFVVYSLVF
ncbi:hypothetical protein GEMRC1_003662 [Eukaryota sp. GEM-RC1]